MIPFALRSRCLALVVLAVPLAAQEAPKHLLRMAYEVGSTTWYRQESKMVQAVSINGRPLTTEMVSSMTVSNEVLGVDGGKGKVKRGFARVTAKMTGMMKVDYDSDDPDSRPGPFATVADMVGESVTMTMDDRGRIDAVETSPDFPEDGAQMFGGDLKQWLAQSVPALPDTPIAVGETWPGEVSMPMGQSGAMKIRIVNKLAEVKDGRARIDQSFEVDRDAMQLPAGVKMEITRASGQTTVELATGMPAESSMEMVTKVTGGPGAPMDMQMTMVVTMRRIEPPAKGAAAGAAGKDDKDGKESPR